MPSEPFASVQIQLNLPLSALGPLLSSLGQLGGGNARVGGFQMPDLPADEIPGQPLVFPDEVVDLGIEPGYNVGPDDFRGLTGPNVKTTPKGYAARQQKA